MIINNTEIAPGNTQRLDVNIARLPSHTEIDISIIVSVAKEPGPILLLMGGLHGDEINGIEIVRRIIENEHHIPIRGAIICIPIINIYGFIHSSRYVPDGKDVNRSFPGNNNGSLASRVAYYLRKHIIPKIDYGIDFHTGGADRSNFPQIRCLLGVNKNKELAAAFNAPFTINSKYRPKSLRHTAAKIGKSILVYEGGESSRFDEMAIQKGVNGTLRVMNHLGLSEIEIKPPDHQNVIFDSTTWVRAKISGLFQCEVKNGQHIKNNQVLGFITDPFGDFKVPVKAKSKGYIIGLNNNPILHQGDAIMHIGIEKA